MVEHDISDVARAAGVSTATVSRALRGLPNVSDATRRRVLSAVADLGYVASPSAASLASGRTRTVGLLTPWVTRWFFSNVIEGAERTLCAHGFDALLSIFRESELDGAGSGLRFDPDALRRRVDGVLVVGMALREPEVAALEALDRPLVFVGPGQRGHVTVGIDDIAAARLATEHLARLGHRRIAHLTGSARDDAPASPAVRRTEGWLRALADLGLEPDPDLLQYVDSASGPLHSGHFGLEGGRRSLHQLMDRRPDVTAVFAASDELAMGAMVAAQERGLRVPDDLSVAGVDGHELSGLVGLTTVAQDARRQGAEAAELVLRLAAGETVLGERLHATRLVVRTSTAHPRSRMSLAAR
ncbi:MAG: LacI family transcriptional regulator [Micrococcales bacterium]|nr:LacI family transcriptional regulator [Micrococcales bacterium]